MGNIKSRIIKTENILWRKAKWFQNEALKEFDQDAKTRLKQSLSNNNFVMPFNVWQDSDDTIWILDGHHRQLALSELDQEGHGIPEYLPATFIQCEGSQDAAKLVLLYSSAYARITGTGLEEFMRINDISLEDIQFEVDLPDFSMPRFEQKFFPVEIEDSTAELIEPPVETKIKPGDLFRLGPHYLSCSDFNSFDFSTVLDGRKVRMVFTDPPYNLPTDYICGDEGKKRHKDFAMAAGEMSDDQFVAFLSNIMHKCISISHDGALHYICMDFRHCWHMCQAANDAYGSFEPKQICVWNKNLGANGSFYRAKHEFVFIFKFGTAKHISHLKLVDRVRYNVWDYASATSMSNPDRDQTKNHPTPKPVNMIVDAIQDVTNDGDIVCDLFLGSGSTLIAADFAGRVCIGTEIEPKYCHVIINRYVKHCEKLGKAVDFEHLNGNLKINDII